MNPRKSLSQTGGRPHRHRSGDCLLQATTPRTSSRAGPRRILALGGVFAAILSVQGFAVSALGGEAEGSEALWTFAWTSDIHLDESRREFVAKAFRHIDENVRPRFLLITGDNNAIPCADRGGAAPEPLGVRRQRYFKDFLQRHLKTPSVVIPGDNWPDGFDQVFGAKQYSFDFGGLHFLLLAPDRTFHGQGAEGLSVFDEATWTWIRGDLERGRRLPTLVVIHEPFVPCTFLDAPRLRQLVDRCPQVIGALQGHLHVDLEFRSGQRAWWVAPSLGKGKPPAFKVVEVHADALVLRTVEYDPAAERFAMTPRRQTLAIGLPHLDPPFRPAAPRFAMDNYRCMPPKPHVHDPALARRSFELWRAIGRTLTEDFLPGR